jgi:hypothetical protein
MQKKRKKEKWGSKNADVGQNRPKTTQILKISPRKTSTFDETALKKNPILTSEFS